MTLKKLKINTISLFCLVASAIFFLTSGIVGYAKTAESRLESQITECEELLIQVALLPNFSDGESKLCELEGFSWMPASAQKIENDIKNLTQQKEDYLMELRVERRDLINEQKTLIEQLQGYGEEYKYESPSREDDLSIQIEKIKTRNNELKGIKEKKRIELLTSFNIYKYFVIEKQNPDLLALVQNDAGTLPSSLLPLINNQINIWNSELSSPINQEVIKLRIFQSQEFVQYADTMQWHSPIESKEYVEITGLDTIDKQIIDLAYQRGYRKRKPITQESLTQYDSTTSLSKPTADSLTRMIAEANIQGIPLTLVSGYRSEEDQKILFLDRLNSNAITKIGKKLNSSDYGTLYLNEIINKTLESTAPPYYSKHHTGYTVDLGYKFGIGQKQVPFENTMAFDWLSADNYYNAKRFGFLPSYPKNTNNIGPEPESWEYVWVGDLTLKTQ